MANGKLLLLLIISIIIISCKSQPKENAPVDTPDTQTKTVTKNTDVFDPSQISQERIDATRRDVHTFIDQLNKIIENKNYNGWVNALSPEYLEQISSEENLAKINERLKAQKVVLKTARDYFNHVVVPSRSRSRVDYLDIDIEFLSQNRVKAYAVVKNKDGSTEKQVLYALEQTNNMWKIIN